MVVSRPQTAERGEEAARRGRAKIKRSEIDFLLLAVFGARYLPDDVAARIAHRRDFAYSLADAFDRHPDLGPPRTSTVEALSA